MKGNIRDMGKYSIETKSIIFRDLLAEVKEEGKSFYEILEKNDEKCEQLFLIVSQIDSMIKGFENFRVQRGELTNKHFSILACILDDIEDTFDNYREKKKSAETLSQELKDKGFLERLEHIKKKTLIYDDGKKKK